MNQETDACEISLSRALAKKVDAVVSTDESVFLELITNNKAATLNYAYRNKRLSLRKKEAGCISESKSLTKKRLNLVHYDDPEAVNLLSEQLVELGREACSRLSISGSQTVSDFSETIHESESNSQKLPVTLKTVALKGSPFAPVGNQDHSSDLQVESNKTAPPSYPGSVNFSQTLCSTAKDVDSLLNSESFEPISYTCDVHKLSIIPPKDDHAYNVLQAVPFAESQPTPLYSRCKPELKYENYLTELERLKDKHCITSESSEPNASRSLSAMLPLAYNLTDTVVTSYDHTRKYQSPYNLTQHHAGYPVKVRDRRF